MEVTPPSPCPLPFGSNFMHKMSTHKMSRRSHILSMEVASCSPSPSGGGSEFTHCRTRCLAAHKSSMKVATDVASCTPLPWSGGSKSTHAHMSSMEVATEVVSCSSSELLSCFGWRPPLLTSASIWASSSSMRSARSASASPPLSITARRSR